MPVAGWNGNFEANGNGGWTGSITPNTLASDIRRGYASAMTDTGHEGGSASFALAIPRNTDFGYRARPRNGGHGQSHDHGFLWAGSEAFVLEWLFRGR